MGNEKEKTMSDQNLVDAFLKNTIPTIKGEATKYGEAIYDSAKNVGRAINDSSFFQTFLRMGDEQVNRLGLSPQLHQQMQQGEAANNYSPQTTRDALDPNMSDETFFQRFMGVKNTQPVMTSFDFGEYDQQSYDDWHQLNGITPTLERGHQFSRIPSGPNVGLQLILP